MLYSEYIRIVIIDKSQRFLQLRAFCDEEEVLANIAAIESAMFHDDVEAIELISTLGSNLLGNLFDQVDIPFYPNGFESVVAEIDELKSVSEKAAGLLLAFIRIFSYLFLQERKELASEMAEVLAEPQIHVLETLSRMFDKQELTRASKYYIMVVVKALGEFLDTERKRGVITQIGSETLRQELMLHWQLES